MAVQQTALDLSKTHFRRLSRGFNVAGTWYRAEGETRWEPCLAITPAFQVIGHERTTPCVVLLKNAFRWREEAYAGENAGRFLAAMGLSWDAKRALALAITVHDHLGDLLSIPPRPQDDAVLVADIVTTDEAGRERYAAVFDVQ